MPKAILSVYDKTGLVDFARGLAELGWTLLASGGTAKTLNENGIAVMEVAEYTKSPRSWAVESKHSIRPCMAGCWRVPPRLTTNNCSI